jgi:hypothetical protein
MSPFSIEALDALIASLESELANDPRYKALQDLRSARAALGGGPAALEQEPASPNSRRPAPVAEGRQMTPARARAYQLSREHLAGKQEPVKTKTLYSLLDAAGVELPGGTNNLASLLGRFPKVFQSHGRAGWTLVESQHSSANGSEKPEAADDLISRSASAASISSPPDQRTRLQ